MQVQCTIHAESAFPALEILDAQCEQLPNSTLWDMLGAQALNTSLAADVTTHEDWILDQERNHGMDLRDVLLHLEPFKLHFGVVPLGGTRTVKIRFRNRSRLALFSPAGNRNVCHGGFLRPLGMMAGPSYRTFGGASVV